MSQPREQASSDRDAGARDARKERERLTRAHRGSCLEADPLRLGELLFLFNPVQSRDSPRNSGGRAALYSSPKQLEAKQHRAVHSEERCRQVGTREETL